MGSVFENFESLKKESKENFLKKYPKDSIVINIGSATCEIAAGSDKIHKKLLKLLKDNNLKNIQIKKVGCTGRCSLEPILTIYKNQKFEVYVQVDETKLEEIFTSHILKNLVLGKYLISHENEQLTETQNILDHQPITHDFFERFKDIPFFNKQTRVALKNCGIIDPLSFDEYVNHFGFQSIAKILDKNDKKNVIDIVTKSKLRGRGGAGFLTGKKWSYITDKSDKTRFIICNADEGDPGAFMDRSMLESDPFSIIEGMMIAGFAIGAETGFFYIRAEYPLAVERIEKAIKIVKEKKLLGINILGSSFNFDLEIRLGAGAFVCGEETALIQSIEGERGQPKIRPPYPAEKGLFGKPTIINNVETLANLPVIFSIGLDNFVKIGSEKSGGTKVFAVSGKITHTGLVEVPIGTPLSYIVYDICKGAPNNKKIKAVQTGGPAGGCIPNELLNTKVDYEDILRVGSIMGSGGLIVLDEDDCMVSVARFFMSFSRDESCGKCTPCREGTVRMLEILDRIVTGQGVLEDLNKLKRLGRLMQRASLCGLGRACANPVLSTIKYYEKEYISHIVDKKCEAKCCSMCLKEENFV